MPGAQISPESFEVTKDCLFAFEAAFEIVFEEMKLDTDVLEETFA